jgi:hypothetical protein
MNAILNRRGALAGLGGLTALWAVPTVAGAQGVLTWTPKALSADEARTLSAACERIMPTTDTPGAIAAGVPQYIDRAVANWMAPADAERFRAGLKRLDADARGKHGAPFAGLPAAQQDAILTAAEAEARAAMAKGPHFFQTLREFTTAGYFTSEIGATKALRYDPVPGAYRGCVPLKEIGRAWAT